MKIKKQVYTIPNENDIKYSLTLILISMTKYILVYLKCALTFKHRFYMGLKIAYKWFLKFEKKIRGAFLQARIQLCVKMYNLPMSASASASIRTFHCTLRCRIWKWDRGIVECTVNKKLFILLLICKSRKNTIYILTINISHLISEKHVLMISWKCLLRWANVSHIIMKQK